MHRLQQDLKEVGTDSAKVARNKEFLKDLKQDVYVEEAVAIIQNGLK
ncbi:hypothetical protein GCM10028895_23130 [Pontibacter rugosus]